MFGTKGHRMFRIPHLRLVRFAAFTCIVAWAVPDALAQDGERIPVLMAYEEFPPYSFTDVDGRARGLAIDLFESLAETAGYTPAYVSAENPRAALDMIGAGEADLTSLLALTDERRAAGLATQTLGAFTLRAYVRSDSHAHTLEALAGSRVGAVTGTYALTKASMIPFARIVEYPDTTALIVPLLAGEIDVVVTASDSFLARLRSAQVDRQVRAISPELATSPYGFIIAANQPGIHATLDDAIATELTPGKLRILRNIWFGQPTRFYDTQPFWWGLLGAVCAIAAMIVLLRRSRRDRSKVRALSLENKANALLVKALDEVSAAIVIFDHEMRAIHWNRGFEEIFPNLIEAIHSGATMYELMYQSYRDGSILSELDEAEFDARVREQINLIRTRPTTSREVTTREGTVFEARDFRLGKSHFASIRVDITGIHAQRRTIEEQARTLARANAQLTEFAAVAAHDLRSPLGRQMMLMDMISADFEKADITLPGNVPRFWEMTQEISTQMSRLIDDLLDYAQADLADTRSARVEPGGVLHEITQFISPPPGFVLDIMPDMPEVAVNRTAFGTVMRNLLSNAIKHHDRETGRISVSVETGDGMAVFEVRDDGPGVPADKKISVFEPFQRLTNATGGSGLGLAFIKKTVEGWGGDVWIEDAPGRGSVFIVTVPLAGAEVVDLAPVESA